MNKKMFRLGILLLAGLTLGGCVVMGGHGYRGYGYGYSVDYGLGYGYYDYPYSYDYHGYGYPHIGKDRGWPGHQDRRGHRGWDGHRRSGRK